MEMETIRRLRHYDCSHRRLADIVLHRVGYTTDNDEEWIAKARTEEMLDGILLDTQADSFRLFLSDSRENNFRYHLWNGYKANRTYPRPKHYDFIKELLITKWDAQIAIGMEADDALGINQVKNNQWPEPFGLATIKPEGAWYIGPPSTPEGVGTSVICSIDKDLMQIPGLHYNFVTKVNKVVTPEEGARSFYTSILVGDTSDNIKGCSGIGPVKAGKALRECKTDTEYMDTIVELYKKQEEHRSTEEILDHILLAGRLLKIKQEEDEPLWHCPRLEQIQASYAQSIQLTQGEGSQSTGHI